MGRPSFGREGHRQGQASSPRSGRRDALELEDRTLRERAMRFTAASITFTVPDVEEASRFLSERFGFA